MTARTTSRRCVRTCIIITTGEIIQQTCQRICSHVFRLIDFVAIVTVMKQRCQIAISESSLAAQQERKRKNRYLRFYKRYSVHVRKTKKLKLRRVFPILGTLGSNGLNKSHSLSNNLSTTICSGQIVFIYWGGCHGTL